MSKVKSAQLIVSGTGELVSETLVSARLRNSGEHGFDCSIGGPSRTSQEFADECDVNVIMRQYAKTGVLPRYGEVEPRYVDWSEPVDFMGAMNTIIAAEAEFARLPAAVRKEFDNDPAKFVEYASKSNTDADVNEQLVKWGLAKAPDAPPAPVQVEVINPAGAAPEPAQAGSKAE